MRFKTKDGMTFTEIVFSLALLIIAWLVAVDVILVSKGSSSFAKHRVQAMYTMQRTIETLRKRPFSSIASATNTRVIDDRGTATTSDDLNGTEVVTVTSPNTYYKKVIAVISWKEAYFGNLYSKTMKERCGAYIANDPQAN